MPKEDGKRSEHAWLASLHELLDTLRSDGWLIGPSEHMAVERVVLELAGDHVLPHDPATLAAVLGPIVSSNPREQEQFRQRFLVWSAQWASLRPGPEPVGPDEPRPKPIETPPPPATRPLKIALGVGAALVLIYAGLYYFKLLPGQSPDTGIKPIDEKTEEPRTPDAPDPEPEPEPDTPWLLWLGAVAGSWILFEGVRHINTRRWLARYSTLGPITVRRIPVRGISGVTDDRQTQEGAAVLLRTREHVATDELDVEATIQETAEAAGWITPMYTTRRVTPEFVALVDRRSGNDHQAHVIDARLQELRTQGVEISRYWFDSDPRYPSNEDAESAIPIEELAGQRGHNRLWLFADANLVQDPETGEAAPWLEEFSGWSKRNLLTVEPSANWGSAERLAEGSGLRVRPADVEGLKESLSEEAGERPNLEEIDALPPMYPEPLDEDPDAWLQPDPPEEEAVAWMLEELGDYLGEAGMAWLASCAVYPELKYELTLYLGSRLRLEGGTSILEQDHERLAERRRRGHRYGTPSTLERLSRLPWFRVGWMPDWLRERLIAETPPDVERATRSALKELLARNRPSDHPDEFVIEVAWEDPRRGTVEGAGVDRVFLRTMEDPLYVRVPREFLKRLGAAWRQATEAGGASDRLEPLPLVTTWAIPMMVFSFLVCLRMVGVSNEFIVGGKLLESTGESVAKGAPAIFGAAVLCGWYLLVFLRRLVEDETHVRRRVLGDSYIVMLLGVSGLWYLDSASESPLVEILPILTLGPLVSALALGLPALGLLELLGRRLRMGSPIAQRLVRMGSRLPDAVMQKLAEESSAFIPPEPEPPLRPRRTLLAALLTATAVSIIHLFVLMNWMVPASDRDRDWPTFFLPIVLYFAASTIHQLPQRIARPYTRLAMELGCWVAVLTVASIRLEGGDVHFHIALWERAAAGMALWLVLAVLRAALGGLASRESENERTWPVTIADVAEGLLPDRALRLVKRSLEHREHLRIGISIAIAVVTGLSLGTWTRFHGFPDSWVLWTLMYGLLCLAGGISGGMRMPWPIVLTFTACWWVANPAFEPMAWWSVFLLALAVQIAVVLPRIARRKSLASGKPTKEEATEKTSTEGTASETGPPGSAPAKISSAEEAPTKEAPARLDPLPIATTWALPMMLVCLIYGLAFIGFDLQTLVSGWLQPLGPSFALHGLGMILGLAVAAWYLLVVARRLVETSEHVKRRILIDTYLLALFTMPMLSIGARVFGDPIEWLVGPLLLGGPMALFVGWRNRRIDMGGARARRLVKLGARMPDAKLAQAANLATSTLLESGTEPPRPLRPLWAALTTSLVISLLHFFVLVTGLVPEFHEARHWPIYLLPLLIYYLASTLNQLGQQVPRPFSRLALEIGVWVAFTILVGLRNEVVVENLNAAIWQRVAAGMALWVVLAATRVNLGRKANHHPEDSWPVEVADIAEGFLPDRLLISIRRTATHRQFLRYGLSIAIAVVTGIALGCWTRFHGFPESWLLWTLMYGLLCLAGLVAGDKNLASPIALSFTACWWIVNPTFDPMKWWMVFTLGVAVQTAAMVATRAAVAGAAEGIGSGPVAAWLLSPAGPPGKMLKRTLVTLGGAVLVGAALDRVGVHLPDSLPALGVMAVTLLLIVTAGRSWMRWIPIAGVVLGVLGYVLLSSAFVVELSDGRQVITGFELLDYADKMVQATPFSPKEYLDASGGDPTRVWTSASLLTVEVLLALAFGLALGSLALLVPASRTASVRAPSHSASSESQRQADRPASRPSTSSSPSGRAETDAEASEDGSGYPAVFISYRRSDTRADAERLAADLQARGFSVFLDLVDLKPGMEWRSQVRNSLDRADAVLVMIGPDWTSGSRSESKQGSPEPGDLVYDEVSYALRTSRLVVPVLVGGADMPSPDELPGSIAELAFRNALELGASTWDENVARLVGAIRRLESKDPPEPDELPPTPEGAGWY